MAIGIGIGTPFGGPRNTYLSAQQIVTRALAMKTVCFVGDSITNYAQYRHGVMSSLGLWRNDIRLVGTQNRPWEAGAGDVPDVQCWPAAGYPGEKFTDWQTNLSARMAVLRYTPDLFVIFLGTNDASYDALDGAGLFERARTFCLSILQIFPSAKILISTIHKRSYPWNLGDVTAINALIDSYNSLLLSTPIHSNVATINAFGTVVSQDMAYNDSVHPTFEAGMRMGRILAPAIDALLGARGEGPLPQSVLLRKASPCLEVTNTTNGKATRATDAGAFTSSDRFFVRFFGRINTISSGSMVGYDGGGGNYTTGWCLNAQADGSLRIYRGSGSFIASIPGALTAGEDFALYWHVEPGLGTAGAPLSTVWKATSKGIRLLDQRTINSDPATTGGKLVVGVQTPLAGVLALFNDFCLGKGTSVPHVDDFHRYITSDWFCGRGGIPGTTQYYQLTEGTGTSCYDTTFSTTQLPYLAMTGGIGWSAAGTVARIWDDNK